MGIFGGQLANVVEWTGFNDGVSIFRKWPNDEIKKGSRLILHAGQDAIFMYNGKVEGIFKDEGAYDIESQIIPFLSTLKGFKFGFNSGMRCEVLFVNTKDITLRWGTKNPIAIAANGLPGGLPIRAFGNYVIKVADYMTLLENVAGAGEYNATQVSERIESMLSQLLMKWITKEGKDMFNLQANAFDISKGIKDDIDMDLRKIGLTISDFTITSFSYPEQIQAMQEKAAAQAMVGDVNKYTQIAAADSMGKSGGAGGGIASQMMNAAMGIQLGNQMVNQMNQAQAGAAHAAPAAGGAVPKFCPNCGTPTNGANFCSNCGTKLA